MKKAILATLILISSSFAMEGKEMVVYKSPYCGCCTKWIDIMKEKGFDVKTVLLNNVNEIKQRVGITQESASCHTAIVDGYVVEGHVNYSAIKKMLTQKPDIIGLSVPKMPIGSPGMEQGGIKESYNVVSINKDGSLEVYERH